MAISMIIKLDILAVPTKQTMSAETRVELNFPTPSFERREAKSVSYLILVVYGKMVGLAECAGMCPSLSLRPERTLAKNIGGARFSDDDLTISFTLYLLNNLAKILDGLQPNHQSPPWLRLTTGKHAGSFLVYHHLPVLVVLHLDLKQT